MNLVFETLNGKTGIIAVKGSDTLDTIKAKIQKTVLTVKELQANTGSDTDITQSCSRVNLVLPLLGMHIVINYDTTGRKFILDVDSSCTVDQVISMIKKKEGSLTMKNNMFLFFKGTKLEVCRTLDDYNIQSNDTLDLLFEKSPKMQIFVKLFSKTITLKVYKSTTVADLRAKIEKKLGFQYRIQRLIYGSKVLADNRWLAYYGIDKECTILMPDIPHYRTSSHAG